MAINEPAIKLYCDNCIFFVAAEPCPPVYDFGPPKYQLEKCLAPQNFSDTYSKAHSLPISQPKVINQYNDCAWYIEEGTGSSSCSSGMPPGPPIPPGKNLYPMFEIISGNTTGTDTDYNLSYSPYGDVVLIYVNGVLQRPTVDYSLVGNTIIFGAVVPQGSNIQANYSYLA